MFISETLLSILYILFHVSPKSIGFETMVLWAILQKQKWIHRFDVFEMV